MFFIIPPSAKGYFIDSKDFNIFQRKIEQYNHSFMLPFRNNIHQQSIQRRKTKQGDWVCIRCSNYNYSFRTLCNRCRVQTKDENSNTISLLTNQNFGENLFPSALFLKLDPCRVNKDITLYSVRENIQKVEWSQKIEKVEESIVLRQNKWINNLINE